MYTWSVALWANWICYLKASATSAMPSKVGRTEGRQNRSGGWALDGHLRFNEEKLGFIVPADNPKIASTNKISWPIDLNWFNTPNQIWVYHLGVQHSKVRPFSVLAMVCHIVFFSPTKTPFETLVQDGLSWFVYVGVRSRDRIAFRIAYVFFGTKKYFYFRFPSLITAGQPHILYYGIQGRDHELHRICSNHLLQVGGESAPCCHLGNC